MRTCGKRAKALFPDPEGMEATWECATSLHSGLAAVESGGQQSEHVAFWNPLCWCPVPIFIVHTLHIFIVSYAHNLSQENKSQRSSTDNIDHLSRPWRVNLGPDDFFFTTVFSSRKVFPLQGNIIVENISEKIFTHEMFLQGTYNRIIPLRREMCPEISCLQKTFLEEHSKGRFSSRTWDFSRETIPVGIVASGKFLQEIFIVPLFMLIFTSASLFSLSSFPPPLSLPLPPPSLSLCIYLSISSFSASSLSPPPVLYFLQLAFLSTLYPPKQFSSLPMQSSLLSNDYSPNLFSSKFFLLRVHSF